MIQHSIFSVMKRSDRFSSHVKCHSFKRRGLIPRLRLWTTNMLSWTDLEMFANKIPRNRKVTPEKCNSASTGDGIYCVKILISPTAVNHISLSPGFFSTIDSESHETFNIHDVSEHRLKNLPGFSMEKFFFRIF